MADTIAYHVGSNIPGYLPEGDVTCWDDASDAREALLTIMLEHVDHLGDACNDSDVDPECDDCDVYQVARKITEELSRDVLAHSGEWQREGVTVYLPTGRELPLAFWLTPVSMDHVAECEPLTD